MYRQAKKLANAGRLPSFELDQAYQDKLMAQDAYLRAQEQCQQVLDEFKLFLALPPTANFQLDETELENLKAVAMAQPDFSETQAIETALARRLDLVNSVGAVIDAQRKVLVAADELRPGLNLLANTAIPLGSDKFREQIDDTITIGLELDLSLDNLDERNNFRTAQITLSQKQREYEEAADTIKLELRKAYRDLTEASQRYQIQLQSLELAQRRFKNTMLLLQYTRANTCDILDAQKALCDAQNTATEPLIAYAIATLNFYRDAGVLQVKPDGMWQR